MRCPDSDYMCKDPGLLTCLGDLNDCTGHGECYKGSCFCRLGWGGADCSVEICVPTVGCADVCLLDSLSLLCRAQCVCEHRAKERIPRQTKFPDLRETSDTGIRMPSLRILWSARMRYLVQWRRGSRRALQRRHRPPAAPANVTARQ